MSDFSYVSYARYFLFDASPSELQLDPPLNETPGIIPDSDNDDAFERPEAALPDELFVPGGFSPGEPETLGYIGTVEIGGTVFPAFGFSREVGDGIPGGSGLTFTQLVVYVFFDTPTTPPARVPREDLTLGESYAFCFAPDTAVDTPSGAVAVQDLSIGDLVCTAEGGPVPVKWIGRQTLMTRFAGDRACPVRITAGALGRGLPRRDLTVTADHGMILEGLVINAGALVNGTTIRLVPARELPERITYYHVETEAHDVILAEGAPAETFIDYAARAAFDNHADYVALYGDEAPIPEMDRPRVSSARLLPPALKARLARAQVA